MNARRALCTLALLLAAAGCDRSSRVEGTYGYTRDIATIEVALLPEEKFLMSFGLNKRRRQLGGTYTVAGDTVTLTNNVGKKTTAVVRGDTLHLYLSDSDPLPLVKKPTQ